jgi:hypothetical protein
LGFLGNMNDSFQVRRSHNAEVEVATAEDHGLRSAWGAAWLREYRCHTHYRSLLALEAVEELELRLAWLDWWNATCLCRDALRRLERLNLGFEQ